LCSAAILYVQVDGEDAIGEENLQTGDSVQSVVLRAVEQRLIRPIFWMDVAGWQLRRSDGTLVAEGTRRSVLLEKLLPFPSECLLTVTRLTSAAPSASLTASPAPLSVAAIVAENPVVADDGGRKSWPINYKLRIAAETASDAFPFYLPFVNRENQCKECVENFRQHFDTRHGTSVKAVTRDAAIKDYKVVVSAGGPGIGQSCIPHRL
jgi:hypothetical protein